MRLLFFLIIIPLFFSEGCNSGVENDHPIPVLHTSREAFILEVSETGYKGLQTVTTDTLDINMGKAGRTGDVYLITEEGTLNVKYRRDNLAQALLVRQTDTLLVRITYGDEVGATYSAAYIRKNNGKVSVETPEVYELTNIALALTDIGRHHPYMINRNSAYYRQVIDEFGSFRQHPEILRLDKRVKEAPESFDRFRMNSYSYKFEGDEIVNAGIYSQIQEGTNPFEDMRTSLAEFARESNFREFYRQQTARYDSVAQQLHQYLSFEGMWDWLENNFPAEYNSYKIVCSPLVSSSDGTVSFEDNGFKETIVFAGSPEPVNDSLFTGVTYQRKLFTEIADNYIVPVSDNYANEIERAMEDHKYWIANSQIYFPSALDVINEYMTWAVYTLYAYDNYSGEEFEKIKTDTERVMATEKGFIHFPVFNTQLLEHYRSKPETNPVTDLYPEMIRWLERNELGGNSSSK